MEKHLITKQVRVSVAEGVKKKTNSSPEISIPVTLFFFTLQLNFHSWTWERRYVSVHLCVFIVSKLNAISPRCFCTVRWVENSQGSLSFKDPQLNMSNLLADMLTCYNTTWSPQGDFSYHQILMKIALLGL